MYNSKKTFIFVICVFLFSNLYSSTFNDKLSEEEYTKIQNNEVVIRNINFPKNICLNRGISDTSDQLLQIIDDLDPKYLAEVIQIKPVKGNEDLPEKLLYLLNNVSEYAGIPYYSERKQKWYDLYSSAEITEKTQDGNKSFIKAKLVMAPFDIVYEDIELIENSNAILYSAVNTNKLRYLDKFDCVWPYKMKMNILLLQINDNWLLYGIGGVNAPRIPFFTERIEVSFINRIKTFCSFIFNKI